MNITKRVLAFLLVLFLMFGNVTPAMATGLTEEETVAAPETQAEATVEETSAEPADAVITAAPSTPHEIVDAAYALGEGEALEGTYTLTGKIISVDTAYNATYSNITVTIVVEGRETKPIQCFRLKGTGADTLAVGDTITVTGSLKNYYGTIEFDQGCTLDAVVKAEPEVTEPGEAADATMTFVAGNRVEWDTEHQLWQCDGITLTNNKGGSTSNVADYTDPARFYKGSSIKIEYPGMTKIVFTCTGGTKYVLAEADIAALGAVTTDGFSVTLELKDAADVIEFVAASNQVRCSKIEVYSTGTAVNPEEPEVTEPEVTEPEVTEPEVTEPEVTEPAPSEPSNDEIKVGVAYKFGMIQENVGTDVYYLDGNMNGYYMNTTTDSAAAVDVYVEATNGGYYFYTVSSDGAVVYINMVVSGTHVNGAFEATPSTVYTYDNDKDTLIANIDGADYWFGTRNDKTYTTVGPVKVEYNGFYCKFYEVTSTEPDPTEPEVTEPEVTEPEVTEPAEPAGPAASLDFTTYANRTSYTANEQYWAQNGITLSNTNSSNIRNNENDGHVRLYAGSTIKIEYPAMTKLVFTTTYNTYVAPLEADLAAFGAVTVDGLTITLELAEPTDSIEWVASKQERLTNLDVYAFVDPTLGTAENPILVNFAMNDQYTAGDATVKVPANTTYYFYAYNIGGMVLTINGENPQVLEGMPRMPITFTVTNDTDAAAEYALHIEYPAGTQMNPEVLTWLGWQHTSLEAGDGDGYFYTYTADATGVLSFNFAEGTGDVADIVINNMNTYAQRSLVMDGVDGILSVEVTAGDVLMIQVVALPDAEWNIPALELDWIFNYPAGTELNPIMVNFEMNETYTEGTATVVIPANTTHYFYAYNIGGMILTVNGENPQLMQGMPRMPIHFTVTNETDAEAEFVLHVAYPAGHQMNPEQLYWLGQQHTSLTEGDNDGHFYTYTVENDGVLSFYFNEPMGETADIVVTNMNTYAQSSLLNEGAGEILSLDVTAGDVLNIQIVALPDADWNIPALELDWNVNYPLGSELNPQMVEFAMNEDYTAGTANVAVPARTTRYFQAYGVGGMMLHVNGEEYQLLEGNPRMPVVFTLVNDTDVDWEYVLTVTYPVGSQMNPGTLNVYTVGENEEYEGDNQTWVEADNWNGYIYSWTAPMAGELTITMEDGFAGWAYSIYNLNTYEMTEMHYSCDVPAVPSETIAVNGGDVIQIMVNTCGDDTATIPGGMVTFRATYNKIYGTEENPYEIDKDLVWNEDYTEATATIVVPAHTIYWVRTWQNGKLVTIDVNGETFGPKLLEDPEWDGILLTMDNPTDEPLTYVLHFAFPPAAPGTWDNPAELVMGENSAEIEENSWNGYLYQWTATERGWLTIDVAEGVASWNYQINNLTQGMYGDPYDSLNTPEMTSQTVEVRAGDVIQISLNTAMDYETWSSPAGTVTVIASFEPGEGTASKPIMVYNPEGMTWGEMWGNDSTHYSAYGVGGMLMNVHVGMGAAIVEVGGNTYEVAAGEWIQIPVVSMNPRMPVDFAVKCNDEYVSYEFYFSYPVGHMNNPHFPTMGKKNTIDIEAGSQGHYIRWQATGSGFLEFTMNTKTGWSYTINNVTAGIYGDMNWSDADPVATKSYVAVTEGDIIDIVVNTYDPENPWTAPEGKITFTPKLITAYKNEVVSGKSLTLKFINTDNGKTVTNSKVTWELYMYERDEWGDIVLDENWQKVKKPVPAEIATIKAGKLTTAKGIEDATEIVVEGTYGDTKNFYNITIRPAASAVRLELTEHNYMTEESTVIENANGQTVNWILNYAEMGLKAITSPDGASEKVTVKSSNTNILKVAVDNEGYCYLQPVWNAKKMSYGSGKVTVTVTTADGSNKKATITFNISTLADEVNVLPKNNQWIVASGKTLNMIANVSTYATNKAVDWSVVTAVWDEEMGHYVERPDLAPVASISAKGVLTANKNLKEAAYVIVKATAKDGGGAMGTAIITVAPAAKKVEINAPAEHDISNGTEIFISGKAISADGAFETSDLKWTISDKKVASGFYYGMGWNEETWTEEEGIYLQLTGKTGKVTLTATATDGSKVSAKATIKVVKSPSVVELNMHGAYLAAGKSLTLKATVGAETYDLETDTFVLDTNVTDKTVTWDAKVVEYAEVTDEWGNTYVDFVEVEDVDLGLSIKGGKLTVNKKKFDAYYAEAGEWAYVKVTATAKMTNAWGETISDHCIVSVTPATNKVNIVRTTIDNVITGKTLTIDDNATLVLGAIPNPIDAAGMFTWKSSNTKVATVVENRDGSVTVAPAGKLGTATITATAADGSGKSAKVTVKVISKVDSLSIDTEQFVLIGSKAGKSFDLNKLLTVSPANASNKKVTWSIAEWDAEIAKANKITLASNGKMTAKMDVAEPVTVTVIAKAADGLGAMTTARLTITPATKAVTIVNQNGAEVANSQEVAIGGSLILSATSNPAQAAGVYTWKSSNAKIAKIVENEDGTIAVVGVKTGTATITATAADGSGKKSTISVKVVKGVPAEIYDVTIWVSGHDGMDQMTLEMIKAFETAYPGIKINATIEGVSEGDAGNMIIADVASAPDIYCFAQDQLARLIQAGALAAPSAEIAQQVKAENDGGSVAAASLAGVLYAYPMTSDNGYFMYYDKSIISEEDAESLEAIIAACEANNVKFRFALENSWYTASFFFGAGCRSNWHTNENGEFISVDDNFNSEAGLVAMKGMEKLAKSPCYDSNADIFTDAGVVITGVWNAWAAADHFGDNLGATDLPSFEVDGNSYHIGSFSGNKLMGVKPQADAEKAGVLALLAQWLTNEENQMKRYEYYNFGPSNLKAQASEAVQSDVSLAALLKQNNYAQPQGQIHGAWWDIARRLGAAARDAASEDDLKAALAEYEGMIQSLFGMSDAEKNAWSVIGSICGTNWDVDFPMYEVEPGVYLSDIMELLAGDEFKCRQGASWDVNFGADVLNGSNFVVKKDGVYQVKLVWDGGQNGTVSLIPVE